MYKGSNIYEQYTDCILFDIAKECLKSIILPGIAVNGTVTSGEVTNWLEILGYEL